MLPDDDIRFTGKNDHHVDDGEVLWRKTRGRSDRFQRSIKLITQSDFAMEKADFIRVSEVEKQDMTRCVWVGEKTKMQTRTCYSTHQAVSKNHSLKILVKRG